MSKYHLCRKFKQYTGFSLKGSQTRDSMPTSAFYNVLMNKMGGIIDKMAASKGADRVCDIESQS